MVLTKVSQRGSNLVSESLRAGSLSPSISGVSAAAYGCGAAVYGSSFAVYSSSTAAHGVHAALYSDRAAIYGVCAAMNACNLPRVASSLTCIARMCVCVCVCVCVEQQGSTSSATSPRTGPMPDLSLGAGQLLLPSLFPVPPSRFAPRDRQCELADGCVL
eukprot:970930-Rhodomonas_salina.4